MQRRPDLVLRLDHGEQTRSRLNVVIWTVALVATVVLAGARVDVFWLLAALVAGLSLSGSV